MRESIKLKIYIRRILIVDTAIVDYTLDITVRCK
jgi:hypothetical protein